MLAQDLRESIEPEGDSRPWFALLVRSRWENSVAENLSGRGLSCFLPSYHTRRVWSDRVRQVQVPLFPGYLFCQIDPNNRLPVLTTPGLLQIVSAGKTPVPVDESEIHALQRIVQSGFPRQPYPFLRVGDWVRIERGPLVGLEGILLKDRGRERLVVSISLLQRSVEVNVDRAWVTSARRSDQGRLSQLGDYRTLSPATV